MNRLGIHIILQNICIQHRCGHSIRKQLYGGRELPHQFSQKIKIKFNLKTIYFKI